MKPLLAKGSTEYRNAKAALQKALVSLNLDMLVDGTPLSLPARQSSVMVVVMLDLIKSKGVDNSTSQKGQKGNQTHSCDRIIKFLDPNSTSADNVFAVIVEHGDRSGGSFWGPADEARDNGCFRKYISHTQL